jgi:hypothetical protein
MSISFALVNAAYNGLRGQREAFERAARKLAESTVHHSMVEASGQRATADHEVKSLGDGSVDQGLSGPMLDILLAQRAYAASIRAAQVATDLAREATGLGSQDG